jgi:hypothetical protein
MGMPVGLAKIRERLLLGRTLGRRLDLQASSASKGRRTRRFSRDARMISDLPGRAKPWLNNVPCDALLPQ